MEDDLTWKKSEERVRIPSKSYAPIYLSLLLDRGLDGYKHRDYIVFNYESDLTRNLSNARTCAARLDLSSCTRSYPGVNLSRCNLFGT